MKVSNITKIEKMNTTLMSNYRKQNNVQRRKESSGGYEYIVYASDQDMD